MMIDLSAKFSIGAAGKAPQSSAVSNASLSAGDTSITAPRALAGPLSGETGGQGAPSPNAHLRRQHIESHAGLPSPNAHLRRPHAGGDNGGQSTGRLMGALESQLEREGVSQGNLRPAAAALAGNVIQESRINPSAVHDHGTGHGIYGARNDRRTRMFQWLGENRYPRNSLEGQARYMAHEAMTRPEYSETRRSLHGATPANVGGVANTIMRNFERPLHHDANRAANARAVLRDLKPRGGD